MLHIPYKGGTGAISDVLGGRVAVYFASLLSSAAYIDSGRLKALAVSSPGRLPQLPTIPSVAEQGLAGFDIQTWHGVFVPQGTPSSIIDKLAKAIKLALSDKMLEDRLLKQGYTLIGNSPQAFSVFIDDEISRWASMAKSRNIVLDQ